MRDRGFTLAEIVVVLLIFAVVAAVAIPAYSPSRVHRLDLAASQVADAIRFARSEAMRTGAAHGFQVNPGAKGLRLFSIDTSELPPAIIFDVEHPLTKRPYTVDFGSASLTKGVDLGASADWLGTCSLLADLGLVGFLGDGIPRCGLPWTVLLNEGTVTLTLGVHQRVVTLHGETGRVTVQ